VSAGTTADAENHSDIAATWHSAITQIENAFEPNRPPGTITVSLQSDTGSTGRARRGPADVRPAADD
jgi:hypothetical protein